MALLNYLREAASPADGMKDLVVHGEALDHEGDQDTDDYENGVHGSHHKSCQHNQTLKFKIKEFSYAIYKSIKLLSMICLSLSYVPRSPGYT